MVTSDRITSVLHYYCMQQPPKILDSWPELTWKWCSKSWHQDFSILGPLRQLQFSILRTLAPLAPGVLPLLWPGHAVALRSGEAGLGAFLGPIGSNVTSIFFGSLFDYYQKVQEIMIYQHFPRNFKLLDTILASWTLWFSSVFPGHLKVYFPEVLPGVGCQRKHFLGTFLPFYHLIPKKTRVTWIFLGTFTP